MFTISSYSYAPLSVYFCLVVIFFPSTAHAYLDPGSGNALVYLVISLAGALVYSAKNFFYALLGKVKGEKKKDLSLKNEHEKICIFSEGKPYWQTFKPVVESFIAKEVPFSYITMDKYDPALTIDNPYMFSKYIGKDSSGYAKVANKRATLMLSTTPNIGTDGFPIPRPKYVQCLAHIFHAFGGIAPYHKHSLDSYDAVLMSADYVEDGIRTIEKLRDLPPKQCLSVGLPYFDELAKKVQKRTEDNDKKVILIAPSWGDKGLLTMYGTQFIHEIAQANYEIIIRPHPQSWKVEAELLENIQNELSQYGNIAFDAEVDATASLQKADLMISDKSGVRFDFALLYERPVITIDVPIVNAEKYEGHDIGVIWVDSVAHELGAVYTPQEDMSILSVIEDSLRLPVKYFAEFRQKHITNFTKSGDAITEWALQKIDVVK